MPVLLEGISVIVRLSAIRDRYPGGWDAFRAMVPNGTLCADNHLARVGFMSPVAADEFVRSLQASSGLRFLEDGCAVDLVVADQQRGFTSACDWAEFIHLDLNGDWQQRVAACRVAGSDEQSLEAPEGWTYRNSLSGAYSHCNFREVPGHLEYLGQEDGQDVFRVRSTGQLLYRAVECHSLPPGTVEVPSTNVSLLLGSGEDPELESLAAHNLAVAFNTLDVTVIQDLLSNDIRYESQNVLDAVRGRKKVFKRR